MNDLRLRFLDSPNADLPLGTGVHVVPLDVDLPGDAGLQITRDRRGLWLSVGPDLPGVHVNGRPVQQVALLRPGDCIHVGTQTLQVLGPVHSGPERDDAGPISPDGERLVLRGLGGSHHGRAYPLRSDVCIGGPGADIALDGLPPATAVAWVRARAGRVLLQASEQLRELQVNGQPMRHAALQPGDQLLVHGQRLLLESPASSYAGLRKQAPAMPVDLPASDDTPAPAASTRVPWLLLAALGLAAALAALLLLGG